MTHAAPPTGSAPGSAASSDRRDRYRQQTLASIGGWSGTIIAAVPTAVFVAVNVAASLRTAVIAAVGSAMLLAAVRLIRRQPMSQVGTGLFGVLVAALIANATGEARNYFLVGILGSFGYGLVFAISMVVRRPLVGVVWEFLDPITAHPPAPESSDSSVSLAWYHRRPLRRAYQLATAAGVVVFFGRGVVQLLLYLSEHTLWLGIARVVMGYPLWIAAAGSGFWLVRRARRAVTGTPASPG